MLIFAIQSNWKHSPYEIDALIEISDATTHKNLSNTLKTLFDKFADLTWECSDDKIPINKITLDKDTVVRKLAEYVLKDKNGSGSFFMQDVIKPYPKSGGYLFPVEFQFYLKNSINP